MCRSEKIRKTQCFQRIREIGIAEKLAKRNLLEVVGCSLQSDLRSSESPEVRNRRDRLICLISIEFQESFYGAATKNSVRCWTLKPYES
jgi:hypothetical protein